MLYISLIFISLGIFFIIYSILIESNDRINLSGIDGRDSEVKDNEYKEGDDKRDYSSGYSEEASNFEDVSADVQDKTGESGFLNVEELDDVEEVVFNAEGNNGKADSKKDEDSNFAILYEDSSGIFDYDTSTSIIDSTINDYKMIKRIGRGKIAISKDGVNFSVNKKFYRFDYHRIEDIKHGSNYIALMLKNSNTVRLFLFESDTILGPRLKQRYRDFITAIK